MHPLAPLCLTPYRHNHPDEWLFPGTQELADGLAEGVAARGYERGAPQVSASG